MTKPILMRWNGAEFEPQSRFRRYCDETFVIGQLYSFTEDEPTSTPGRRYYFAALGEAWKNLPEDLAYDYPDKEMLRKKALIATGWADEEAFLCKSHDEARRMAAFIGALDRYAVVQLSGPAVKVWRARSQKARGGMTRDEFKKSADDVLAFCADLIGVKPDELQKEAEHGE